MIIAAPSITWLLVTIYPSDVKITPEPLLVAVELCRYEPFAFDVEIMLTTAGETLSYMSGIAICPPDAVVAVFLTESSGPLFAMDRVLLAGFLSESPPVNASKEIAKILKHKSDVTTALTTATKIGFLNGCFFTFGR